ncbi:MAG: PEP-CTERM sorting domain-containing protein [Opitutaceae bacterium]|nr:PEP-CTERM sorting domain-containing protein [Opitutaceae bacterium]
MKIRYLTLAATLLAAFAANAHATVLISESFSGYTVGDINGQAVSATGLAGNWTATIAGTSGNTTAATYTSTGLSFGNLATSGGAMTLTAGATTSGTNTLIIGANTATATSPGVITLYASYLYQTDSGYVAASHAINQRVGNTANAASSTTGSRFFLNPDNTNTLSSAAVSYATGSNVTTGGSVPAVNTTYFTVGKFTNVNGGAAGGTASMVTLDLAQFNDWQADGGTESLLFARTQGTGDQAARVRLDDSESVGATYVGGTSTFLQATLNLGTATGSFSTTFDEFKYGTDFGDVVSVIPEPSTYALLVGGLGLGLAASRRRRSF